MKRILIFLMAVMVMISSVSLAEDLSSMPDDDLLELYMRVTEEIADRYTSSWQESPPQPAGNTDESIAERVTAFFHDWYQNRQDDMLALCASDWKSKTENPRFELFRILANRTPLNMEIIAMFGKPDDTVRTVSVVSVISRNNGQAPLQYLFRITMKKEADGLWYVDPESLLTYEELKEEYAAEPTPEPGETNPEVSDDTILYCHPEGGQYYHADRNCKAVNEKYLPLKGSFTYGELENEPYKSLQPCSVCGAPSRRENPSLSADFRDAVESAGEFISVGGDMDYLAAVAEKGGEYIRMVTLLDDHAKKLYMAAMGAEDSGEAFETFNAYAWSLPVSYTEEITAKPKGQAELDAQAGKTVGELLAEGYSFYGIGGGEYLPTAVDLSYGLFNYEFEVDASFEQYLENEGWDGLEDMKVKSGILSGFSGLATNPDWLADGTYEPQVIPNITAEEAAATDQAPPPEEYTVKAWPLDTEGYSDLLNNMEDRYGQVYMVEGAVHQVLSESPQRVIINTGEDGKSQPVIVECPEYVSFSPKAGESCRIYADVTSSCYILPVLTARYIFSCETAGPADEPAVSAE